MPNIVSININVRRPWSVVRPSVANPLLLKSFISQTLFNNTFFCLVWSFLKNVTMHCKRKLWVGGRVCINKCRVGVSMGGGAHPPCVEEIEIRDCLDVF